MSAYDELVQVAREMIKTASAESTHAFNCAVASMRDCDCGHAEISDAAEKLEAALARVEGEADKKVSDPDIPILEVQPSACAFPVMEGGALFAPGLTKRELFAAMAMQGYMAATNIEYGGFAHPMDLADSAIEIADALIAKLAARGSANVKVKK